MQAARCECSEQQARGKVLIDFEPAANWFNWAYRCLEEKQRGFALEVQGLLLRGGFLRFSSPFQASLRMVLQASNAKNRHFLQPMGALFRQPL